MERTINFELTYDDYLNLKSALNEQIGYLEADIRSLSRNIDKALNKENYEYCIAHDEKKIKSYTALVDKLENIYMSYFL